MAAPSPFYSMAPSCIQHHLPGGVFPSDQIAAPFRKCFEQSGGFFSQGPGENWDATGKVIQHASGGLWAITVIGIIVMIAAFVAWVWTEHRTLIERA